MDCVAQIDLQDISIILSYGKTKIHLLRKGVLEPFVIRCSSEEQIDRLLKNLITHKEQYYTLLESEVYESKN